MQLLNQLEKINSSYWMTFGLHPLDNTTWLALLQIHEDRYGKKSLIITSQVPIKNWFVYINEPTLADGCNDRLSNAKRNRVEGRIVTKGKIKKINLSFIIAIRVAHFAPEPWLAFTGIISENVKYDKVGSPTTQRGIKSCRWLILL